MPRPGPRPPSQREAIVAEAEQIAGQPAASTQWKTSGERMRTLLDQWKQHQRSGAKLDKATESALWQRFSHARNSFDKARRAWFADLETSRAEARATKEELVAEAEELATSTDWTPTARAFKQLMDRWRAAGRASRAEDDALWERFRTAQDAFFAAKDEVVGRRGRGVPRPTSPSRRSCSPRPTPCCRSPTSRPRRPTLRGIQDRWEQAGKVPRADLERVEKRMRRVETAVREADEQRWKRTNPEVAARARSLVDQLEASVASIEADLAKAEARGDAKAAEAARGPADRPAGVAGPGARRSGRVRRLTPQASVRRPPVTR